MTEEDTRRRINQLEKQLENYNLEKECYLNAENKLNETITYLNNAKNYIPTLETQLELSFVINSQIACRQEIEDAEQLLLDTIKNLKSIKSTVSTEIRTLIRKIDRTETSITSLENSLLSYFE